MCIVSCGVWRDGPAGAWVYVCTTPLCWTSKKQPRWADVAVPLSVAPGQQIKVKVFLQRVNKRTGVPIARCV